jgi:hypothetical protein
MVCLEQMTHSKLNHNKTIGRKYVCLFSFFVRRIVFFTVNNC